MVRAEVKRSFIVRSFGRFIKLFTVRARFVSLGGQQNGPVLIVSNHAAAAGPLTWLFWFNKPKRFWAAHENTEGIRSVYRYMAHNYFPQKRHVNKTLSSIIAFIACPFISLFFKYVAPIPTYRTAGKFISTIRESEETIREGESIVIFPEDSSNGYSDRPYRFFCGFAALGDRLLHRGIDIPVVVSFFSKRKHIVVMDKPILFSVLKKHYSNREGLVESVRLRLVELADMVNESEFSA